MARIATDAADDVGRVVAGLWTVVLAVTNLTTVLTSLILIVAEGTVECGEFAELIALELVLAFGDGGGLPIISCLSSSVRFQGAYRFNDVVDQLLGFVDLLFSICHDQAVQILILVAGVSGVRFSFALFDRAFASNCDLGAGLGLHLFQRISTRSDQEANC